MKRSLTIALIAGVLLTGVATVAAAAPPVGHHHRIVRLHHRIERLRVRVARLEAANRALRDKLAVNRVPTSTDTTTITFHMPATTAPDGFQCAEITNTHQTLVSSLSTMPTFVALLRGSASIVANKPDGSSVTYAYDQAQPYNPCTDPATQTSRHSSP